MTREGLGLVAVSYDPVPVLADFASRRAITFPLLSDAGSAVIKQYGILNTTVAPTSATYGIPFPGTFVLDRDGIVTSRHFEAAYQERDTITSVLVRRGALPIERPQCDRPGDRRRLRREAHLVVARLIGERRRDPHLAAILQRT